jgi:3-oxoacyl-(acyl-carrier-protein) synthase
MPEPPRVLVTGIGLVSPLGERATFWEGVCAGASAVAPASGFDSGAAPPRRAARARDWQPKAHVKPALLRRMDRFSQMIVTACRTALADAALALDPALAEETGIVVGTAFGNLSESEQFLRGLLAKGPALANPLTFPNLVLNAPTGYVAIELGLHGPNFTVCRGEASGEGALALAYDTIASGQADVLLAGGADEIAPVLLHMYADLGLLSPQDGGREWSSPFDRRRNGFVVGEGAAMLVLERAERARARGARAYAELAGYATQSVPASPHDWPRPSDAAPAETARQLEALGWARPGGTPHPAGALDLIVSCANSTVALDGFEAANLAALLGEGASRALVTSVKGAIGEFGGAGAFGAAAAALALATGELPRLGALDEADPAFTLRFAAPGVPAPGGGFRGALVSASPRGGACLTLYLRGADAP